MFRILLAMVMLLAAGSAGAQLNVVATTANMGMLTESVGGEHVRVRVLAPPNRDAHYLDVRPTMMAALRRADLLVAVGADLEIGWLPPAIQGAANPRIQAGRLGYFEAAAQVERIHAHGITDRAMGDVHPEGSPHVYMDPMRMAAIARALAERLGELDPGNAQRYADNAGEFADAVEQHLPRWLGLAADAPGVVLYHEDSDYLMQRLGVAVLGYVEPVPGSPPTAAHLRELVNDLRGRAGVVIHAGYQPARGPEFLAGELGWTVHVLPTSVDIGDTAADYFDLIDRWVEALVSAADERT
ncbi:MAG: metal ABC transporter substrate-binding protein [Aquisalimonadaceae bacterium]